MKYTPRLISALPLNSILGLLLLVAPVAPVRSAGTDAGAYEIIANAFTVVIDGAPTAATDIKEIEIDDLIIEQRETTTGLDVEYRLYAPGATHWGNARFSVAAHSNTSHQLQQWLAETARGKNVRRQITISILQPDKSVGRTYTLFDCFPTGMHTSFDSAGRAAEIFEVSMSRIEFSSAAETPPAMNSARRLSLSATAAHSAPSDKFAQVRGFKVEIDGTGGKDVDTAWESVSGGELIIELTDTTIGGDKFHTSSPGHKSVNEIVLKGAMTNRRAALCQWINDTTQGKPWKRNVNLTEVLLDGRDGTVHRLEWALPRRYIFPRLSVYQHYILEEQIEFGVIRGNSDLAGAQLALLDIAGAPKASENALLIAIEDLNMDIALLEKEGDARRLIANIAVAAGTGAELAEWLASAEKGLPAGRSMTVALFSADNLQLRTFNLFDCFPTSLSASREIRAETVTVKVGRIEMK